MNAPEMKPVHIIGGGLAGSEAAWQIASAGVPVVLHEMRGVPGVKTDAHHTDGLAELVCSNSFRSDDWEHNAVGLLHEEMRRANGLIIAMGDRHKVPAGSALAVDRDGFSADVHQIIRGKDLTDDKEAALAALRELDIPTQLIFVATKGVNDHQIGQAVDLLVREPHILSLNFQPVAFTGQGGGAFAHDPMDRITIPGVIRCMDQQSGGALRYQDFFPLPCSHPQCVSLTYLLRLNDGSCLPFARFVDFEKYTTLLRSSATLPATTEVEEALHELVHDVFARQDEIERGPEILAALRRSLDEMFPPRPLSAKDAIRASERQSKSIFLHHYMDRHDFDLERLRKCCHHYPQVDGKIMPACGFNMFHRGAAKGATGDRRRLPVVT